MYDVCIVNVSALKILIIIIKGMCMDVLIKWPASDVTKLLNSLTANCCKLQDC